MNYSRSLASCHNILDLRDRAKRRLPNPVFHFLDGAAETELTAARNTAAFEDQKLLPKCLVDVESVKTSTRILGQDVDWPLICSPTGISRLFHPEGELAVARAASEAGIFYSLASGSTYSVEQVAAASSGPKMFQLYIYKDRDITMELIERCKRAQFAALCLTVDVPVIGKRERDLRLGFSARPRWSVRNVASFARCPAWVVGYLRKGPIALANFSARGGQRGELDPSVTWKDLRNIVEWWGGPFALKGVMSTEDARRAADEGVTAIIVSNHGGRQLDGAAATIEALPKVARAVGDRVEVILDGGIRRGVHVLKALALGAKACSVGRPYLYGLAAGGEAGVSKALEILRSELLLSMRLSGCTDVRAIDGNIIMSSP